MTVRMTNRVLEAKVDTVNRMLGFDPENLDYKKVQGWIELAGAYGGTGIHKIINEYRGVSVLLGYGTKKEAAIFLDGMISALRITSEV